MNLRMNDNPAGDEAGEWIITTSKLHFVDLAGSERVSAHIILFSSMN
jgi:hypothetical protein